MMDLINIVFGDVPEEFYIFKIIVLIIVVFWFIRIVSLPLEMTVIAIKNKIAKRR